MLKAWRKRQRDERELVGPAAYEDNDLVFPGPDGTPSNPDAFSQSFDRLVARPSISRIRLQDLRHTHASILLKAGVPVKVVSERLGLEADNHPYVECVGDARQRVEIRAVPATLDPGDLRVARADELRQLLLAEALVHSVLDEEPRDFTHALPICLLGSVLGTAGGPSGGRFLGSAANRTGHRGALGTRWRLGDCFWELCGNARGGSLLAARFSRLILRSISSCRAGARLSTKSLTGSRPSGSR